ncbi:MAG TPA: type II toxin-antitoxin system RelE/ParE family toxin [Candidatus Dormibacteraeota bacterium]|nr:type II toxin-antitoxin system RelE/ParE family toxin [Candidatus Dormibacteraeota bacterium]
MTAFQVIITEPAEQDLHTVINYISKELHNPLAAKKLLRNIKLKVELLKTYPKRFPLVRDKVLALKNIRKIPIDHYLIFYTVDESTKQVTIVRILYAKRNWIDLL